MCGLTCLFIRGKFSRLASILKLKCLNHPNYPTQVHEFHCFKHKIPKYLCWYLFSRHISYKPDSTKLDFLVGSIHVLYFIYSFKHDPSPCDLLEKSKECGLKGIGRFFLKFFFLFFFEKQIHTYIRESEKDYTRNAHHKLHSKTTLTIRKVCG